MADYLVTDTELTAIADAIRTKGGTSSALEFPTGFVTEIGNISGGGGGATTVSFDDNCTFLGGYISYIDGNGDYQHTTSLAMMSAVSYQMLSKSLLVYCHNIDPAMSGNITGTPVGMTLVDTKNISFSRGTAYLRFYQVD